MRSTPYYVNTREEAELARLGTLRWLSPMRKLHIIAEKNVSIILVYNPLLLAAFHNVMASLPSLFAEICVCMDSTTSLRPFHKTEKEKNCHPRKTLKSVSDIEAFFVSATIRFITSIPQISFTHLTGLGSAFYPSASAAPSTPQPASTQRT